MSCNKGTRRDQTIFVTDDSMIHQLTRPTKSASPCGQCNDSANKRGQRTSAMRTSAKSRTLVVCSSLKSCKLKKPLFLQFYFFKMLFGGKGNWGKHKYNEQKMVDLSGNQLLFVTTCRDYSCPKVIYVYSTSPETPMKARQKLEYSIYQYII